MKRLAIVLLLVPLLAAAQASLLVKTPALAWSKDGYQQLRFGMGTGDVEEALRKPGFPLSTRKALELKQEGEGLLSAMVKGHAVKVAGYPMEVKLGFVQGKLYVVELHPLDDEGGRAVAPPGFSEQVYTLLYDKYGTPSDSEATYAQWIKGDLEIFLGRVAAVVSYKSTSLFKQATALINRRDRERFRKEKENL